MLCSKKLERSSANPLWRNPNPHSFFLSFAVGSSTFCSFYNLQQTVVPEKRRKIPSFSPIQSPFVWSQRKHLLLQFNHTFLSPKGCSFFSSKSITFWGPKGGCILFSNSNHFFGSQRMMMHVILQFNYFCVCSLSLSLSLSHVLVEFQLFHLLWY